MTTKRFSDNPTPVALTGNEVIPASSPDGGVDGAGAAIAAGSDIAVPLHQLLGLKVYVVAVSGGIATVDCGRGLNTNHALTLSANVKLALTNIAAPGYVTQGEIRFRQDATGGRTVELPASFKPLGASHTAVKGAPNGVTILSFKSMDSGATFEYAMQEIP